MKAIAFILAVVGLVSTQLARAADSASDTLQKGLFEEEANHNLDAAIKAYQAVIARHDDQRKLAATAVFRLGECYRKLGRTNEATAQYQRILREFPDQTPLVALSRSYVQASGSAQSAQTTPGQSADRELLTYLKGLNPEELRKALPGVVSDPLLNKLASQLAEAQQNLAAMTVTHSVGHPEVKKVELRLKTMNAQIDERQEGILKGLEARVAASTATEGTSPELAGATDEEEKEIRRIKTLIKDSPDLINSADGQGITPLHRAAQAGQLVVARFLLANKAEVNAHGKRSDNTGTPLLSAAIGGHKTMTELLLSSGADVNSAGTMWGAEGTPLHLAASKGFMTVVEVLLAKRANVNARNSEGRTPLHAAAEGGYRAIAELLLANGAEINAKDSSDLTPLDFAASKGHLSVADLLLARKADVNAGGKNGSPVVTAVARGHLKVAEALLDHGTDVNAKAPGGESLLHIALGGKSVEMLKLILAHKPDLEVQDQQKYTPLQRASEVNAELVRLLLAAGANANTPFGPDSPGLSFQPPNVIFYPSGNSPLIVAIVKGSIEVVEALLVGGANINVKSQEGKTALHYAVQKQSLPMVTAILARHPDIDARDNYGGTPLLYSAWQRETKIVEALLKAGADPNAVSGSVNQALHLAVLNRRKETIELLLANKANVNLINKEGDTPLALAQRKSGNPGEQAAQDDIAALLLKHGADENIRRRSFIMVSRAERNLTDTVFFKGMNDYNRHTLLELAAKFFSDTVSSRAGQYVFPDFTNVKIKRLNPKPGTIPEIKVDLEAILKSGDCSQDVPLEWGDIVEIPELDHRANETWTGLTKEVQVALKKCLKRTVQIKVKGETTIVLLLPSFNPMRTDGEGIPTEGAGKMLRSFRLKSVLQGANVIRVSSDLSRVRVKRFDLITGQDVELLFDLSDRQAAGSGPLPAGGFRAIPARSALESGLGAGGIVLPPALDASGAVIYGRAGGESQEERTDLWLRDGDVIEVPEK